MRLWCDRGTIYCLERRHSAPIPSELQVTPTLMEEASVITLLHVKRTLHSETRLVYWLVLLSDSEETHLFSAECNFQRKYVSAAGRSVKRGRKWKSGRILPAPLSCFILFHLRWPVLLKTDAAPKWNLHFLIPWMTRPAPLCPRKQIFIFLFLGILHLTLDVRQLKPVQSLWVCNGGLTEVLYAQKSHPRDVLDSSRC